MDNNMLTAGQMTELLNKSPVGRISLNSPDGFPYILPVHFVYLDEKIYIHCSKKGRKLDCIANDPKTGFEVDEMNGLLFNEAKDSCNVSTLFNSVVITGNARVITCQDAKRQALNKIVEKYTPDFAGKVLPEDKINAAAVIEITITKISGKHH